MTKNTKYTKYTQNIKVNIVVLRDSKAKRTSTTLNFDLCDYFIGKVRNMKKREELMQNGMDNYRIWLEKAVQAWVKEQPVQEQRRLETTLLEAIYDAGYKKGMGTDKQLSLV